MKIFQAFSLLTIAHGSKVMRINFRKEGEGLGSRLGQSITVVEGARTAAWKLCGSSSADKAVECT